MEKIIKELTQEQLNLLPTFVTKWTNLGLSTEPADRKATEKAVREAYLTAGLSVPKHILWADSPQAGHDLHCKLRGKREWITPFYGQHDAGWLAFYDVFREFGVDVSKIDALTEVGKHCGWVWLFAGGAVCVERPCKILKDARDRLHNPEGMAVEYPDGWGVYALNGVMVPAKVVLDPNGFTAQEIRKITNTEVTRALAERLGWDKYLSKLGIHVIDSYTDETTGLKYELLESAHRFGDLEPRFIRKQSSVLKDGSQPWYLEPVEPSLRSAKAARKFQAMSGFADNNEQEYAALVEHCNSDPELQYSWES